MKQSVFGLAAWVALAAALVAGNAAAQDKAALTTEREKLSYAIGLDVARSFAPISKQIDVASMEKAVKNAFAGGQPLQSEAEAKATDDSLRKSMMAVQGAAPGTLPPAVDKAKVGLMLGDRAVGPGLARIKDEIDLPLVMQAVRTAFANGKSLMTAEEAQATLQAFGQRQQSQAGAKNRAAGIAFLAKNKTQKGVITTPSGLQYMVLRAGNGARPLPSSTVQVNYEGKLLDGTVFDSSYKRGQPATFPLTGVIAGWTEGIPLMSVGAKYRFWIPSELAYGPGGQPQGGIGPDAALTFDVELLGVQ